MPPLAELEGPPSVPIVVASYALLLVLSALLSLWGSFLVPFRVGGVVVPVSWAIAVGGNVALAVAGSRMVGRGGAAVPGIVWAAVAFALAMRRTEGDLVVVGTLVGTGFLVLGALSAFGAYMLLSSRAIPAEPSRR